MSLLALFNPCVIYDIKDLEAFVDLCKIYKDLDWAYLFNKDNGKIEAFYTKKSGIRITREFKECITINTYEDRVFIYPKSCGGIEYSSRVGDQFYYTEFPTPVIESIAELVKYTLHEESAYSGDLRNEDEPSDTTSQE